MQIKPVPTATPRPALRRGAASALLSLFLSTAASANPQGAAIVSGSAGITSPAPGVLEIINDPGTIINWAEFSIGVDEVTRFIQDSPASSVLNRVTGGNPSAILGQLLSNGQVWLINTNGIAFGDNAVVDTAGFIASTLDISNEDYLAGRFELGDGSLTGAIVNGGAIIANGAGDVFLIAPKIENRGLIQTDNGDVVLAAGRKARLTSLEYDNITFELQSPDDSAVNLGTLKSMGGAVAAYAGQLDQRGAIEADRMVESDDGTIHLVAGSNRVGGTLSARGGGDVKGGSVRILGDDITLSGARIDAGGGAGGGEVLVGGDYQGGGGVRTADATAVDAASRIDASATGDGDGGRIIVWADGRTESFGRLSARGGPAGGDGGLVETSGLKSLDFEQPADVGAPNGRPGTWLIDPEDIDIDASKAASIETALNEGSGVTVKTADSGDGEGNINVNSSIHKSEGGPAALTLDAHNEIRVNAGIRSTSDKLDVNLRAGRGIAMNGSIETNGGRLSSTIVNPQQDMAALIDETDRPEPEENTDAGVDDPDAAPPATGNAAGDDEQEGAGEALAAAGAVQESDTVEPATGIAGADGIGESAIEDDAVSHDAESVAAAGAASNAAEPATEPATATPDITINGEVITAGGDIIVDSGPAGRSVVSGTLDAANRLGGQTGGDIQVLGSEVALSGEARIDASGDAGGGDVLIGGDYKGGNDEVRNAQNTSVAAGVLIEADAVSGGDAGKVIVWADESTVFRGRISATGGARGGDGGFAEVSGKQNLGFDGVVDLSAPEGARGTLLLDPANVVITQFAEVFDDSELDDNEILAGDPTGSPFSDFFISPGAVETSLAGADTLIEASSEISLESPVSWATGSRLTLNAGTDVNINADLDGGSDGDITLIAGDNIDTGAGDVISGDDLVLDGGTDVTVTTSVNTVSGNAGTGLFSVDNTGALTVAGTGVSAGGDISIVASRPIIISVFGGGGVVALATSGLLTVDSPITATGSNSILLAAEGDTADDDLAINANLTATTGDIDLYAGDTITQATPSAAFEGIETTTGSINIYAGTDYAGGEPGSGTSTGDFIQQGGGFVTIYSPGGDVNIEASRNVVLDRVINDFLTATSQSRIVAGGGSITIQGTAISPRVFGPEFTLEAETGIDISTGFSNFGTLSASNYTSGDIVIDEAGNLIVTGLSNDAPGGAIEISNGGWIDINTAVSTNNGDITVDAGGAEVTFSSGMDAGSGDIVVTADTDILSDSLVNPAVALAGTNVSLAAGNEISVRTAATNIEAKSAVSGNVTIVDNDGVNIGNGGAGIDTLNGAISVTGNGPINVLETINAGSNGGVTLATATGDIVIGADINSNDAGTGDGSGSIDLQASGGSITSSGGKVSAAGGTLTATAAGDVVLDTQVASAGIQSNVAGDIALNEDDAVVLGTLSTTASDITVTSGGSLTATSIVAGGGGSVFLTAANGDIYVGFISAPGEITLTALAGNIEDLQDDLALDIDAGGGATLNAAGSVGGNSPAGSAVDPAGVVEGVFTLVGEPPAPGTPGPGATPMTPSGPADFPPPLPPGMPGMPAMPPVDDIINQVVSLQLNVDPYLDLPENDGQMNYVEERTQCF